ncbi:MAG: heavy metal translocating P-type ATPase [Candidatus Planktophila sp.]|nr:heavy metal translocating P-type ATPase [Candidatus Planktophila sp.]
MRPQNVNRGLLLLTLILLSLGFFNEYIWGIATVLGLIPALLWVLIDLHRKTFGSDLLAVLSLCATFLTHEYFAGAVISLMLASGRVLESWAEGQAERQLKSLLARIPQQSHRFTTTGAIEEIELREIGVNDHLLVRAGEITPVDGMLLTSATLDESALTGEPLPVVRHVNAPILSGVVNAGDVFEYLATNTAEESTYAGIIKMVQSAQARTSPNVRIASKWAMAFIPLALVTAGMAWVITGEVGRAVAVLVAATPCPLILAVPIAVVSGLSRAAKHGAIIKGGATLEALARAEVVLLDKTGTITHGGPRIDEIVVSGDLNRDEVLQLAASVDQYSHHIVANALVASAHKKALTLLPVSALKEVAGHHISGVINGSEITVGQLTHVAPDWLTLSQPLVVAVTRDGELIGAIGLSDPLRPESKSVIAHLRRLGVQRIALVTGDKDSTAQEVAASVGVTEVYSNVSAQGKLDLTEKLMENSRGSVVVVGDGINDAPALAIAHVGVAMGARGATAASEAADVVIVDDSLENLAQAIGTAQRSRGKAIEAAAIGMSLSFLVMMAGAFGFATASEGALAQELIDVVAIFWALTVLKGK